MVIAVRINGVAVSPERPYHEIQSDLIDPVENAEPTLPPPSNPPVTAEQLFLSDTTCNQASRLAITADHNAHNTLGVCSDNLQTGATAGAPDRLFEAAPPASQTVLYDYAVDLEPTLNPANDRGLQLERPATPGCEYAPNGNGAQHLIHRWVTAPMAQSFVLEGSATLQLYTRTLNDAVHPGKICIYLFSRETTVLGGTEDTLLVNSSGAPTPYFTFAQPTWPHFATVGQFGLITIPMTFSGTQIPTGQRLGLAISVDRDGTAGAQALEFAYDHPTRQSRLEVQTATPLP